MEMYLSFAFLHYLLRVMAKPLIPWHAFTSLKSSLLAYMSIIASLTITVQSYFINKINFCAPLISLSYPFPNTFLLAHIDQTLL